ncbi:MAG TPA: COX15/CtaA family protein [Acidimicrobiales bacterium]|nr:COX15/CtaA family protein [Acidimicrobiales bacterium]
MPDRWTVSPATFRRIALGAVVALALLIVSGAAVRLTGSGLGCTDWPNCTRAGVVAPLQAHAWVEFGNRLVNALVTVAALGAFAAALRRRPRRRDLTWLSLGLVGGLLAEVVLGAVVVYTKLDPVLVSIHFILGLAFLAVAVVLYGRAGRPDGSKAPRPVVGPVQLWMGRVCLALLTAVVALGTVVTSTGPHGGAPDAPRYHLSLHSVAQVHGTAVEIFLAVTLLMLWSLTRGGVPAPVLRRAEILLLALVGQAAVGYIQYFNGDPVAVVAVHVAGASALVIAAIRFYSGLWAHPAPDAVEAYEPAAAAVPGGAAIPDGAAVPG